MNTLQTATDLASAASETWEAVSGWVGIAGFVLSLYLYISQWLSHRVKLQVKHALIVPIGDEESEFLLDGFFVNKSDSSLSVHTIGVIPHENVVDRNSRFSVTTLQTTSGKEVEKKHHTVDTPLPFTLAPYESRHIVLSFVRSDAAHEVLHQVLEHTPSPGQSNVEPFAFPLWVYASRGKAKVQVLPEKVVHADEWFERFY